MTDGLELRSKAVSPKDFQSKDDERGAHDCRPEHCARGDKRLIPARRDAGDQLLAKLSATPPKQRSETRASSPVVARLSGGGQQPADQFDALAEAPLICTSQFLADQFLPEFVRPFAVKRPRVGRGADPGRGSSFPDHSDSSSASILIYTALSRVGPRTVTGISQQGV
jgi:hypothetical protein